MISVLRNSLLVLVGLFTTFSLSAQGIVRLPRTPSPAASVSQTVGISTITVHYSRPSVKGREIWGNLVPYGWHVEAYGAGNKSPWRAGANENTTLALSDDAMIEGKAVPAGTYGVFIAVHEDNTAELILSKENRAWGQFWYDESQDAMRSKITVLDHAFTEQLTYDFINVDKNSTTLVLNWEKKQFPIKITFDVDKIVMANASQQLKGSTGFSWQGYNSAATYALQNNVNTDQALRWIDQAIATNKSFTTLQTKAGLLEQAGKQTEADKLKKEALPLANEVELNAYGYQLLAQNKIDQAIEALLSNTIKFPKSANAWDSLGEAYALKGEKKNAIKSFKKSLTLQPSAATKANSEKYLKQLNAL